MCDNSNIVSKEQPDTGSLLYVFIISSVAAIGGLLFGFDVGVIAGAIPFITDHFQLNAHQEGFAVSNIIIGCVIGSAVSGPLSDRYGRKKVLIVAALLFAVSAILSALPRSYAELIIARLIGGIAVGASMVSALYISEISPADKRGFLVSLNQFAIVIGILITYLINWLLVDIGPQNWRVMFACEAVPAVVFFVCLFFVPESPRWLAKAGQTDKAMAVLTRVGGRKHAEAEFGEINRTLHEDKGTINELLQPGLRKALVIGVIISVFAQVVGIGAVIYYAPKIFMSAGFESVSSGLFATVMVGVINFLGTIVAFIIIDRFGRKPLMYIGHIGMAVSMVLIGLLFNVSTGVTVWVVVPVLTFVAFYAMSLGPVAWVIVAEIFPTKIRGRAMAISMVVLWLSDFSVSQTFPWLMEHIEEKTFYIYAVVNVIGFLFALFVVKETKGKSLEEIEKMWSDQP
ncbi:sugar porter family MFS transporter [Candidatus Latescibacterota bacterium]